MLPVCPALDPATNENVSVAASQLVKVNVPVPTWAVIAAGAMLLNLPPVVS
jgi:hypothetical protein